MKISKENSLLVGFLNSEERAKITPNLKLFFEYEQQVYKLAIKDFNKIDDKIWKLIFDIPKELNLKIDKYINGYFAIGKINVLNILFKV